MDHSMAGTNTAVFLPAQQQAKHTKYNRYCTTYIYMA